MFEGFYKYLKDNWFGNVRGDLLAGMVVGLALIPEAIAFSIIAGVDPKVGLYASFCIAVLISIVGGRPGMISAATGAMAVLMVTLVKDYGLQYLFAATILTGILQILAGVLKLGSLMRFVSTSVVTGFVNALAILIFMAQIPEFVGASTHMYAMVALGLAIIYILPRFTTAVPSPLVCIIVVSGIALFFGLDLRTVGDMGELPTAFPAFFIPDVPFTWETLKIILPYSASLAAVGLLESLMTATIVDDMTDTPSKKNKECTGQGMANILAGFFGGMAGCAMIGQSVINIKSGGRSRLSTLFAGVFLLFLILVLSDWVTQIPMAALVAVMIMVSISTFRWQSLKDLIAHPKGSSIVMVATVVTVVVTHDLAIGVGVGVLLSALVFARTVSKLVRVETVLSQDESHLTYIVYGELFFVSASIFTDAIDYDHPARKVAIDLTHCHCWDLCSVDALDKVILKLRRHGAEVELLGLNEASATIVENHAVHDKEDALDFIVRH